MIKKRKKSNVLLIATLASILLMGIGTALADTIDKSYTFSFSGPLAMTYTAAYAKDTKSSMYISVTSTSDSSRSSFKIKPQVFNGDKYVNTGSGGTVEKGKRYEVYNYAVENFGERVPVRFRGERSTASKLTFKGKWSPDYTYESGVIVLP